MSKFVSLILFSVLVACQGGCENPTDRAPLEINYRLKWLFNASAAGDLYAQAYGAFKRHGLRVTVKEGSPERDALKELELGHAQFGVASADQVIRARSKGAPIVIVAQLFQHNPLQWIYRPTHVTIESLDDLKGKTIGVTFGGNDETVMKALLAEHHIRADEVRLFSVRYDYTPFYQGRVDLWPVYKNAQGIIIQEKLRRAGESIAYFNPAAFGIRFVANSVVTTKALFEKHPRMVRAFVSALLEGWRQALDPGNQTKTLDLLHQHDPETPVDLIAKQLAATRTFVQPSPQTPVGHIDTAAWKQTEQIMLSQGLIAKPVHIERILKPPRPPS